MTDHAHGESKEGDIIAEITISDIHLQSIYERARKSYADKGATQDEIDAWLGTPDKINHDTCLKELLYPHALSDVANKIEISSFVIPEDLPLLRKSSIVHASTGNITQKELQAIEEAFGAKTTNHRRACYEHVQHGPLYLSPKDYGFYVRIPEEVTESPKWIDLTPEMRAIVEAAIRQGATTIEFDADEHPTDNLYYFDQ